ncbi:hypothetical protein [Clostridium sp.]|uniref:hypothetical protein n=1 Tax=Clostridium sp. TaxID=1506 RepID=UPI00258619D2|nr:hypothetical protein [Clostridium sp.]
MIRAPTPAHRARSGALRKQIKDYKVEGLVGADTLSGTVTLDYAQTPDMSKTGKLRSTLLVRCQMTTMRSPMFLER